MLSEIETDPPTPRPRRNQPSLTAARAIAAATVSIWGLSGCGADDYCGAVEEHQAELTDLTASGSPAALLEALPILRDLQEHSPDDIRDDWKTFLDPLDQLDDALAAADLDPESYDVEKLPDDLSEEERARIETAATSLADPAVVRAFDSVQQHAKDVCHTPLSL